MGRNPCARAVSKSDYFIMRVQELIPHCSDRFRNFKKLDLYLFEAWKHHCRKFTNTFSHLSRSVDRFFDPTWFNFIFGKNAWSKIFKKSIQNYACHRSMRWPGCRQLRSPRFGYEHRSLKLSSTAWHASSERPQNYPPKLGGQLYELSLTTYSIFIFFS